MKSSVSRLVCILFPELEKLVPSLHIASVYALLEEFPGAKQIAGVHLTRLKALLETASKGRYKRDMAVEIREAARNSIGSRMPAKSLELQHTKVTPLRSASWERIACSSVEGGYSRIAHTQR